MKNNNFKQNFIKGVCLGLTATLMLTGCNSDNKKNSSDDSNQVNVNSTSEGNTMSNDYVYHECALLDIPEDFEVSNINIAGENIYAQAIKYSENYDIIENNIYITDNSGTVKEVIPFNLNENTSIIANLISDSEGNIYYITYEYIDNSTTVDDTNIVYDNIENTYSEKYTLIKADKTGKEIFSIDLGQYAGEEYFYINNICYGSDGNIYISNDTSIIVMDSSGNELFTIDISSDPDIEHISNILLTNENKVVVCYYNNEWVPYICEIDSENKSLGKSYDLKFNTSNINFLNGGGDYNLCYYDSSYMYGINIETGEATPILNWIDSDINASNLIAASILPDGKVVASYYDLLTYKTVTGIFEKSNPEDIKEQQIITLAGNYIGSDLYSVVTKFNKENENYRIKVTDYSSYAKEDDWNAGFTKFNADIALGNIPDIIITDNYSVPMESFISKGVFADISEMIDNDSEINRSDYLENVLEAFSTDGKIYSISPSFYIQSLVGKSSKLDGMTEWDINKFMEYTDNLDEDSQIFSDDSLTSDSLFFSLFINSFDNFIDYSNKSCNFNNEDFIKILEYSKQYPSSEEYYENIQDMTDKEQEDYYNENAKKLRDGLIILQQAYFFSPNYIYRTEMADFGEDITFIGYPSSDGNGSYITTSTELGISAKSENQEGAWEFLKYFLTDEYQDNLSEFPIKKSSLEKKFEEEMTPSTYVDENGETVTSENICYINNNEYNIGYMTEAHKEKYMKFIESINTKAASNNLNIIDILTEETTAYFSGQKTAQETADIIQNRITTYINETL